jgi:calcium-dependent protein kinase
MKSRVRGGKYVFEYDVGLSTFASVAVYKDREASELRTCKTVQKTCLRNPADTMSRLKQLQAFQNLTHPHVARILDVIEEPTTLFIVSEYLAGGDVDDWVEEVQREEDNTCIDEVTCCSYTRQALLALVHCEQQGIVHGDLRPSSLLLTTKESNAVVKVGDFGLASILDPDRSAIRRQAGPYTAPEVLDGSSPAGSASPDVWSLGAVAHALLVGQPPSGGNNSNSGVFAMFSRGNDWAERSPQSRDFVQMMLRPAAERPTAVRALHHPWLKSLIPSARAGPPEAVQDVPSKTLCYMLAVLLVPPLLPLVDFEKLHWAFAQADADADGLAPRHVVQRLLLSRSMTKEAAEASVEIADVGGTGVVDLCAAAVADLIGREFMTNGPIPSAAELGQRLMKRFFEIYGDNQRPTLTCAQIRSRLRTGTLREMERCCGVSYDEVLANFPDNCPLTSQVLAASFINCGGQGTPIGVGMQRNQDPDDLTQCMLGFGDLENVIGGIFKACGLARSNEHGRRRNLSAECL